MEFFSKGQQPLSRLLLLSALFFLIIGSFWLLGSLQEPIFYHLVGAYYHPTVNVISFFAVLPLLFFYIWLLRFYRPDKIFIGFLLFYICFFSVAAFLLAQPTIGFANTTASPDRLLGWAIYAVIKTYGSFLVTLFWSFATSITSLDEAKSWFPLIMAAGQMGSLSGATIAKKAPSLGIITLLYIAISAMVVIATLFYVGSALFAHVRVKQHSYKTNFSFKSFLQQAKSVIKDRRAQTIFVVSTFCLVVTALFDYQMHYLAYRAYPAIEDFTRFKGVYGQLTNGATLVLSLGVTRVVLKKCGMRFCLVLFPLITAFLIALVMFKPILPVLLIAMVAIRSLSFGFNNPAKELLYVGQSGFVRFELKGWIDMFAYRAMYAFGSQVADVLKYSFMMTVYGGGLFSLGLVGVWFLYAYSLDGETSYKA